MILLINILDNDRLMRNSRVNQCQTCECDYIGISSLEGTLLYCANFLLSIYNNVIPPFLSCYNFFFSSVSLFLLLQVHQVTSEKN